MKRTFAALFSAALAWPLMAAAQAPEVHKPVVSIDSIQDMASTGQGDVLKQMIETTIVNTGKFRVMERGAQGMNVLLAEQARAKSGMVTSNTPGKVGGFEGVDFKVYGTITTASAGAKRDVGASTGMRIGGGLARGLLGGGLGNAVGNSFDANSNCTSSSASLAIDIRITDGSTGEVRYAKQITEGASTGTTCGSRSDVDVNALMRSAAQHVSMGLVTIMYPVKVVDVGDDHQIILNYGEGLLAPGDVFAIFQQGKKIVDPDTGAVLGNNEVFLGLVRISDVLPKMSKAVPLTTFTPPVGAVAREPTPDEMRILSAGRKSG
jgi:curli biogenesis system outer membrane secretion channel CsgG